MMRHLGVALAVAVTFLSGCGGYRPGGIEGRVTATAECPHGRPCAADPNLQVWLTVARLPRRPLGIPLDGAPEVQARIAAGSGVFIVALLPGRYIVYGDSSQPGEGGDVCLGQATATVLPHRFAGVSIDCAAGG